jgi:pimeloyl-ACP methyl ester carboxylesterase
METNTQHIDGCDVHYVDTGGEGPVLFLSSGVGQSLEFWQPQIEAFSKTCRVIAWDYPGHGQSDMGRRQFSIETLPRVALKLLDALGIDTAVLVGNSLGGAVSIRMASIAPERVAGIVLAAPALSGPRVGAPFRLMTLPVLGRLMSKASEKGVEMQIKSVFHPSFAPSDMLRAVIHRNTFKPGADRAFAQFMKDTLTLKSVRPDVWKASQDSLRKLQCPVLFIHGQDDQILPSDQAQEQAALTPKATVKIYENCGHAPQLEKPQQFNSDLKEFIEKVL